MEGYIVLASSLPDGRWSFRSCITRAQCRLRQRSTEESGFTLIELLIVCLIIGILAAIAIPAFSAQKGKASDAAAKMQVGTLLTTMQLYASEHNGSYEGASLVKLEAIEPTLKDTTTASVNPVVVEAGGKGFEVSSTAKGTSDVFKLKNKEGEITRTCASPISKKGCTGKEAGSW
jgi:type IV pilus assembly protein PilA